MRISRVAAALCTAALLLLGAPARGVERGESLVGALEELRTAGLRLVFSSALVGAELRVDVEPGGGRPEEIARRILAPHGLALHEVQPGLFAVVRVGPTPSAGQHAADGGGAGGPPAAAPLENVHVYASRYSVEPRGTAALAEVTREDIARLPGLHQDALRVTHFLPGTASSPVTARVHVRGGREDELAVYFDGAPLFEPFHFKDAQGLLGILDPAALSSVEFFSGVFPARFGNRLSGVLDIQPRRWAGENAYSLGASLLYSHALAQGRLEGRPVEWLAAIRRSNLDLVADLAGREEVEPSFLDALARIETGLGERSELAIGWLLLDDQLEASLSDGAEAADVGHRDATSWLTWRFAPDDASELRAVLSYTDRHTDRGGTLLRSGMAQGTLEDRRRFDTLTARLEGARRFGERWQLNAGLEAYEYDAEYRVRAAVQFDPQLAAAFGRPPGFVRDIRLGSGGRAHAAYAGALVTLWSTLTFDLGLRWDAQRYRSAFSDAQISPRLALQYLPDEATTLRASWGRLAQAERPDELQVSDGERAFQPVQRASESVISLERRLRHGSLLRFEAFEKRVSAPRAVYENLFDPLVLLPELEIDRVPVQPLRSRSYGAELSLRWQAGQAWSGWTSYSWSEASDRFAGYTAPRSWDQRNSLAASLAWSHRPWELSGNLTWHNGWRRSELTLDDAGRPALSRRNASSWPDYFSLDLRATWQRRLPRGTLQLHAELINATDHGNSCCTSYARLDSGGELALAPETSVWLPRLLLLGAEWELP